MPINTVAFWVNLFIDVYGTETRKALIQAPGSIPLDKPDIKAEHQYLTS